MEQVLLQWRRFIFYYLSDYEAEKEDELTVKKGNIVSMVFNAELQIFRVIIT